MKKIIAFIVLTIGILGIFVYTFLNFKGNYKLAKNNNLNYEKYLNQEIYGSELASIINMAIDNNEKNKIPKNKKGVYIDNNKNSINIEVKILDDNKTYHAEKFEHGGIQKFVNYYGNIKFKCDKVEYHQSTNRVKYMFFEQISE